MANTGGRPTLLNDEVREKILHGIREQGLYAETAAALAGINRQTFLGWLRAGRKSADSQFADFVEAIDLALEEQEAKDTAAHVALAHGTSSVKCPECSTPVLVPGQVQLTALQWRMQRKYGARWGDKQTIVVEQKAQDAVEEILDAVKPHMPPDAYALFIDALAAAMGEDGMASEAPAADTH